MNRTIWILTLWAVAAACNSQDDDNRADKAKPELDDASSEKAAESAGATAGESSTTDNDSNDNTPGAGSRSGGNTSNGSTKPIGADDEALDAIPENCRGFSFDGLVHSPGGSVLPNKCQPFHPTSNNPYAVRCVDAWPWYKTKFPGDQYCMLPPPPDKGVQYGVHPQGNHWLEQVSTGDMSGYEELSDEWTMESGEEEQANYTSQATNAEPENYYRTYVRMRPGSHHMIVTSSPSITPTETWGPPLTKADERGLPGAQRPDENGPKLLDKPSEDDGLFSTLPASTPVTFNMHHFNATEERILKEVWTNLWWEDDARVELHGIFGLDLMQPAGLSVAPNTTRDLHFAWNIMQPVRLVTTFGHRHAWTSNFSAWIEEPNGSLEILYQSFQWLDEPTYRYDSMTQNPKPNPEARTDGASSGFRMLMPGQKLHFNCHIEYTGERAASVGAPPPTEIGPLRFANEAFTAEMCILFGLTADGELPSPEVSNTTLPDFATLD